jgi:hypothetical protein
MSHDPSHWDYEIKIMKRISFNIVRPYTDAIGIEILVISRSLAHMFMHNGLVYTKQEDMFM